MEEVERELLNGMCNCYAACHEDFEGTVRMVAHARGLSGAEVKSRLASIKEKYSKTNEYAELRASLPKEFLL